MQVPNNIMQIGNPDEFYRIYMEDYVYTYIRQIENEVSSVRRKIYLFGKKEIGQETSYLYIYGAADSEKGVLSIQHDFFEGYEILGILSLFHGEREISFQNGIAFCLKGFFVFYEQNSAMQTFLIHNYQEKENSGETKAAAKPDYAGKKELLQKRKENCKKDNKKKNEPYKSTQGSGFLYIATVSMAIILSIIAITAINRYDKMQGFNEQVLCAASMEEQTQEQAEEQAEKQTKEPSSSMETAVTETAEDAILTNKNIYIEETTSSQNETTASEAIENAEENPDLAKQNEEDKLSSKSSEEEEASSEESVQTASQAQVYVVEQGDSLLSINQKFYGTENRIKEICSLNHITDPDAIQYGQKIILP